MKYFIFDSSSPKAEYYALLEDLIERWEYETVEFKEAKSGIDEDKIGRYFSAISNEANLSGRQYGWLIFGVSEKDHKHIVGSAFKKGDLALLEKFKHSIAQNTTGKTGFMDIIELNPIVDGTEYRVLMFKIPAAAIGIPTEWKGNCYARAGESLISLSLDKVDRIRGRERQDWSKQILPDAMIEHLDKDAIAFAREKFLETIEGPYATDEVKSWTDEGFLSKLKLIEDGKITNAAMLLFGKEEFDYLFPVAPKMMWRLYNFTGDLKDSKLFSIPFILAPDKIFKKVRNLTYRYIPNQQTLFPLETQQYDSWLQRELLHNCIAHTNYRLGGRIYVDEMEDSLTIKNPGIFLPHSIERVLKPGYSPPYYQNALLADAMARFHMIDSATSGIRRVFRIQKEKYFPMPDYDFSEDQQVIVKVYGKTLDERYTQILFNHPELDLETVYLLDQVQKYHGKGLSEETIKYLRKHKLVEGRVNNLFLSAEMAKTIQEQAQYIKNKGFDDQYYRDLIVQYLKQYGKAKKQDIRDLLWDKLPDILDDEKKNRKISTLLTSLRVKGIIETDSKNQQISNWVLVIS